METVMDPATDLPAATPGRDGHGAGTRSGSSGTLPLLAAWCIALGGAFLVGALTSFGQAVGPLATLSNAAGPWFVAAVGLVLVVRPRTAWAPALGVVLLLVMHVGYTATTVLRGYPDSLSLTNPWVVLAFPAGLIAGACAVALRGLGRTAQQRERWRAVAMGAGTALLAGEGIDSLLRVAETTGTVFWIVEIVAGTAVLAAAMLVARSQVGRVIALGTAVVGTAVVLGAYLVLM